MWLRWCLVFMTGIIVASSVEAHAACMEEKPSSGNGVGLVIHLSADCTPAEREARAVRGDAIIDAVAKGRRVDLVGVVIRGDLPFERLSIETHSRREGGAAQALPDKQVGGEEGERVVREWLTIRDSVVWGTVRHRSDTGTLRFEQPVDFQGTRFKEGVDLSRAHFHESVELSGATFEKPAFWVSAQFDRGIGCRGTTFGPSTRFHRAHVRGPMDCTGALFDGMAEFLEVNFGGPALFERARFGLGTGFSGSRFHDRVNFSDAIFSRETFFTFTFFEREAVFAGAQFLGPADFSQAEFKQQDDLQRVRFDQPPLLMHTKRITPQQDRGFLESSAGQYLITVGLLIVAGALVAYAVKSK